MALGHRLLRLERRVGPGPGGCPACRHRLGRHEFVTAVVTPDGATTYPEGFPAKCERCGIVPEFVIEVVERVDAEGEDRDPGPSRPVGG